MTHLLRDELHEISCLDFPRKRGRVHKVSCLLEKFTNFIVCCSCDWNIELISKTEFGSVLLNMKLEDLKVLRRSPDLLNNVKIGQGQLQLLMEQILFLPYTFWSSDLNNLMNNPSNSPVISQKKMFR